MHEDYGESILKRKPMKLYRHISEAFEEATDYMSQRKQGLIKSIKTPWETFNDVGMDGMEWHSTYVISARPGVGKSALASLITKYAHMLNPTQDFNILNFQFEMLARRVAQRELSSVLNRTTKYLNNADKRNPLTETDLLDAIEYGSLQKERKEFIIEKPLTVPEIEKAVREFIKEFPIPLIITLDHSMLVRRSSHHKTDIEMLQDLAAMITKLKREHPIIWLVLSQLNRSIEQQIRLEPGTIGNYPNTNDVFGADALLQHCDVMLAMNKPSKYNLELYGPDRFKIDNKETLAFHFLKVRDGDTRISFFESHLATMNIYEMEPPDREVITRKFKST